MVEYMNITQSCYSVTVDPETQEHRIETTVNTQGELPGTSIFVFTIGDPELTSTDVFSRVGNPQDIQNLNNNREAAIAAGDTEFLINYLSLQYPDLDVAVQAKAMLRTRINELSRSWLTYRDSFTVDSDVALMFPTSDPDVEEELVASYVTARDARIVAEANVTTKEDELEASRDAVTNAQEIHTIYQESLDYDTVLNQQLATYNGLILTPGTEATTYWTTVAGTLTPRTTEIRTLELSWRNTVAARQTEMETAVQDKTQADQELLAAQEVENSALAAVLEINPDFDPASI